MTELYLIRHARAVEHAASDWARALEAEGRREARAVGASLKKEGVSFDVIVTSPLVRAVETATLIAVEVGYDGGLLVEPALTPDGTTPDMLSVCEELARRPQLANRKDARVALVGHEPSMGQLLSDLVGRPGMSLVKAGVVRLDVAGDPQPGACKIVWTMSPRNLRPARG